MHSISSIADGLVRGAFVAVAAIAFAAVRPPDSLAQHTALSGSGILTPIDRWLVSSPFTAEDAAGGSKLTGPGEEGVFPDRGREQAGASWTLVRRDGEDALRLDSLLSGRESPAVAYAHSYVRLPEDRTLMLTWGGLGDTEVSVWVNGRPLRDAGAAPIEAVAERSVPIRLGGGWNTLLFRAAEDDRPGGPFGLTARLSVSQGGGPLRIQASRPPGEIRTGPEPWVIAATQLRSSGRLAWQEDQLLGEVVLEVTAWSRAPIDRARVRLRGDGIDVRGEARWLTPGTPAPVGFWIPLERISRLTDSGGEIELEWADEKVEQRVGGPAFEAPTRTDIEEVYLSGWEVRSVPAGETPDRLGPAGPLPDVAGWTLSGEWKVPSALAGRDLQMNLSATPGDFRIGDRSFRGSDLAPLCSGCRSGQKIEIFARSRGAWASIPTVTFSPAGGDLHD
ncbi:MAG: hypothetical protein P8049_00215 [Gemmatimonadota bacterium]